MVTSTPGSARDRLEIVAHRGFAGVNPENTLAAVRRACADGADAVEVDVVPCAEGDVVVFHDPTPARVTDASGPAASRPVWETPLDTLRELSVLGTGEPVPLLSEVIDVVPPDVALTVEFKHPGSDAIRFGEHLPEEAVPEQRDVWRPFAERVLEVLGSSEHDVLVSSFCEGALAAVRELAPEVPLAAVCRDSVADGLGIARRHDCEALHVPRNMVAGTAMFGDSDYAGGPYEAGDVVAAAHEEGRTVTAWTVETWHQAAELERAGVDGIIADYPHLRRYAAGDGTPATGRDGSAGD